MKIMLNKIVTLLYGTLFESGSKDYNGENQFHKATRQDRLDRLQRLLRDRGGIDEENDVGDTALHLAAAGGSEGLVGALLEAGADPNHRNRLGDTPLHLAVRERRLGVAGLLLQWGATPDLPGYFQNTPLMGAARTGSVGMVRELLARGADPRHRDLSGRTALHAACGGPAPDRYVVNTLLVHGAAPGIQDARGQTALHLAVRARPFPDGLVRDLLDWGASMIERDRDGHEPFELSSEPVLAKYLFGEHIIKVTTAGLGYHLDLDSDINMLTWWAWHRSCEHELHKMRHFRFRGLCVADVFRRQADPAQLASPRVSAAFRRLAQSDVLSRQFPIYANLIRIMFVKAERRLGLLDRAQNIRFPSSTSPLPNELWRMILSYLEDRDLESVIRTTPGGTGLNHYGHLLPIILPRYAL